MAKPGPKPIRWDRQPAEDFRPVMLYIPSPELPDNIYRVQHQGEAPERVELWKAAGIVGFHFPARAVYVRASDVWLLSRHNRFIVPRVFGLKPFPRPEGSPDVVAVNG